MGEVVAKFFINVSKGQCHMERVKAREMIEGNVEENYAKVWNLGLYK